MVDIFGGEDLPAIFSGQAKVANKANIAVAETAGEVIADVKVADAALAASTNLNRQNAELVFDQTQATLDNVRKIRANPFSQLIGMFAAVSPASASYNLQVQRTDLTKQNTRLQRLQMRETNAKQAHTVSVTGASRDLELARTQAEVAQKQLGTLTTEANMRIVQASAEAAERKRLLGGLSVAQLQAGVASPTAVESLGQGIANIGDFQSELVSRKEAIARSQLLGFQTESAKAGATKANISAIKESVDFLLENKATDEDLLKLQAAAKKGEGSLTPKVPLEIAPGVTLPAGVRITQNAIESAIATRQTTQLEESKTRIEQMKAIASNAAIIESADSSIIRMQSQSTGGTLNEAVDISFLPPEIAQKYQSAQSLLDLSAKSENPLDAFQMQTAAAQQIAEIQKISKEQQLAATPKEQKPAMSNWIDFGRVDSTAAAATVTAGTLLNPKALSNPYYKIVGNKLASYATSIRTDESTGVAIEGLPGVFGKKRGKVDDVTFVQEVISLYQSENKGVHPGDAVVADAFVDFNTLVINELAQENAALWSDIVSPSGIYNKKVMNADLQMALPNLYSELDKRTKAAQEGGILQPGESMFDILFTKYQQRMAEFSKEINPLVMEDGAWAKNIFGNGQQNEFIDYVSSTVNANNQAIAFNTEMATREQISAQGTAADVVQRTGLPQIPGGRALKTLAEELRAKLNAEDTNETIVSNQ